MAGAVAAAIAGLAEPADAGRLHERLYRLVLEAVPELRERQQVGGKVRDSMWLARALANLVALEGAPQADFDRLLVDVRAMREGPTGLVNPAGFLHAKYRQFRDRFQNGKNRQRE